MAINPFQAYGDSVVTGPQASKTFGIPDASIKLEVDVLRLVPSSTLALMTNKYNKSIGNAKAQIADTRGDMLRFLGTRIDERDGGNMISMAPGNNSIGTFVNGAIDEYEALKSGMSESGQGMGLEDSDVEALQDALDLMVDSIKKESGISSESNIEIAPDEAMKNVFEQEIAFAEQFIADVNQTLQNINTVLQERAQGVAEEPTVELVDAVETDDAIFRLTFGPPKSTRGSFILSVDGLYYDSQTETYEDESNIPGVLDLEVIPQSEKWKLDHAANLKGRGTAFSIRQLNEYVDTIFDIENIDDSDVLKEYYKADHLLEVLSGQKNLTVTRLDRMKQSVIDQYGENSAMAVNMQQQIFSEIELFDVKIRKRKKQIELAVKAPDLFGSGVFYIPGQVPINDFSFLSKINLAVELSKQKNLVIDQGDVSGMVLPIKPVFAESTANTNTIVVSPLLVTAEKTGALGTDDSGEGSTFSKALTLSDPITNDGLIAIYTFLKADVEKNGSKIFNVGNCTGDANQNAQLISPSAEHAFPKGLSIPRLSGIVRFKNDANTFITTESHGSYVRLPSSTEMQNLMYNPSGCSFDFWLHMPFLGVSRNSWEGLATGSANKIKGIANLYEDTNTGWFDSNYYKIILSNENTGGNPASNNDPDQLKLSQSSDVVRGMTMGFTRDPVFGSTYQEMPSDFITDPNQVPPTGTENCYFFIAPTQSYSSGGASFVRSDDCSTGNAPLHGLVIPIEQLTPGGYSFRQSSDGFIHVNVSFDVKSNKVSVSINGSEFQTGKVNGVSTSVFKISDIFGTDPLQPPRIPTFKKVGTDPSFEYRTSIAATENTSFLNGPKNDEFFTPWILGGGWTDGLASSRLTAPFDLASIEAISGGFMGPGKGLYSGLNGYIGSLKIYSKPLSTSEVSTNYNAHKSFFDNIDLT